MCAVVFCKSLIGNWLLTIRKRSRIKSGVMRTQAHSTTDALALLGRDALNVTQTAATLGISPGAMLAAAWQVLERQHTQAQPWPRVVEGWNDEESAGRQDVVLAAVRLDARQRNARRSAA
jgi:alanyl-tRNA synthetase